MTGARATKVNSVLGEQSVRSVPRDLRRTKRLDRRGVHCCQHALEIGMKAKLLMDDFPIAIQHRHTT